MEEWFEFRVEGEVDLTQYKVSNGKNKSKPLDSSFASETSGYYFFEKSPVSLANDGGVIQILNLNEEIIHEAVYPKTKKGSTKNFDWAEIWHWSDVGQKFVPQRYHTDGDPNFSHTRGAPNTDVPTPSDQFRILVSEVSPDWQREGYDFIELAVVSGPDRINLRSLEIKHNGTQLWRFDRSEWVSPGDLLVWYVGTDTTTKMSDEIFHTAAKEGLSAGSGTIELNALEGTSSETNLDAVCWRDEVLSQTEAKRVQKFRDAGHWQGDCVEISQLIDNESLARDEDFLDTHTAPDWQRHFNGSAGQKNTVQNSPPQAVIRIQGSGKTIGTPPFSLNVTGEDSSDPDGLKDIESYTWKLDGDIFSEKANPANIKLETAKIYQLELTVKDHSGASSTARQTIVVANRVSAPSASNSTEFKAHLKASLASNPADSPSNLSAPERKEDFFAPVLTNKEFVTALFAARKSQSKVLSSVEVITSPKEISDPWPRRIKLPKIVRQRLHKNIGLIWDWRLAPWAAGVGSTSDGAIDQNSERFAIGFGVP